MRCPKCQYLGFEPSPRCKNCGFDFSFGEEPGTLTLVADPEAPPAMADFDPQILDDAPRPAAVRRSFDLDELLATGRAASDPAPVTLELHVPAEMPAAGAPSAPASAVAVSSTPPPEEVERIVREAARVFDEPEPEPEPTVVPEPTPAPIAAAPAPVVLSSVPIEPAAASVGPSSGDHDEPPAPPILRRRRPEPAPVTTELPLFMQGMKSTPAAGTALEDDAPMAATMIPSAAPTADGDDAPLVRVPARPRAPLSVRRTTPDAAAMRAKYARPLTPASGDLLREIETSAPVDVAPVDQPAARMSAEPTPSSLPAEWLAGASTPARLGAAAIDAVLLSAINALVVWLTLIVCGLTAREANLLPIVPLAVFFVVLNGGYLVLFTAACGQTLGKMAAGIRVVGMTTGAVINDRLSIGQAFARAIGAIASVLPLGAGFWMALVGDHRALHDRVAHTRVVRA